MLRLSTFQVEEESTGGAEGKPVSKLASVLEKIPILNKLLSNKMPLKCDKLEPSDAQSKSENVNGSANSGENSQSVEDSKKDR